MAPTVNVSTASIADLISQRDELAEALRDLLGIINAVCPEYVEAPMCASALALIANVEKQP